MSIDTKSVNYLVGTATLLEAIGLLPIHSFAPEENSPTFPDFSYYYRRLESVKNSDSFFGRIIDFV